MKPTFHKGDQIQIGDDEREIWQLVTEPDAGRYAMITRYGKYETVYLGREVKNLTNPAPEPIKLPYEFDGFTLDCHGDAACALIETDGGQWIVATVHDNPFPEDPSADETPWSAIEMAQFITACVNLYLNQQKAQ